MLTFSYMGVGLAASQDINPNETLISSLRPDKMSEGNAVGAGSWLGMPTQNANLGEWITHYLEQMLLWETTWYVGLTGIFLGKQNQMATV